MQPNCKNNMLRISQFIRFCFLFVLFLNLVAADKSTIERIKKHQEWLRQRQSQQKANALAAINYKTTTNELANLWRLRVEPTQTKHKSSANEVYPEYDGHVYNATIENTIKNADNMLIKTLAINNSSAEASTKAVSFAQETPTTENVRLSLDAPIFAVTEAANAELMRKIEITTTAPTATSTTTTSSIKTNSTTTTHTTTTPTTTAPTTTTTTPSTTTTKKQKSKLRPYPRWGSWSKWSDCSRSCGGGISHQQRKCINRNSSTGKRFVSNECIGLYKRYQLCNEQPCRPPPAIDNFRAEQCAVYNDVDFQGHSYSWEPYIKDDAECELNCKPMGMKYFATLKETVIDGTQCGRPAEFYRSNYSSRAICVDGVCKLFYELIMDSAFKLVSGEGWSNNCSPKIYYSYAVKSSGAIMGLYANSGSVSCGGLICRPVTGIFTRNPLPEDAYVHVATIPAGASNISITELKNSANFLVLRTSEQKYIFNGENNIASESGAYEAVDAIFDYHRIDGLQHGEGVTEWITCTGPIMDSLELLIYSKTMNPGVKYEYLLPITYDSEENELSLESDGFLKSGNDGESSVSSSRSIRRRKFNWKVVGFSACTKSCGGGTQTPIVRCVRENPVRYYSQRRCMHSEKPVLNENLLRCNTQPCPAYWRQDDWGECRCTSHGEGYRQRELSCVQELASGIVIHVDNAACMEEQPPIKKECDCPKHRRRTHGRYKTHNSIANSTQINRYHNDKNGGVWMMADWNQYCSTDCGPGVEYRTIFCDRSKQNSERCDSRFIPEITRPCERERICESGEWFVGPWSPCNGNCFNLTRSRQVLCILKQLITDDEDCKAELKPQTIEKCLHEEVEYCAPRWHYSEWTECTKSCDGGTQRRTVKCLEYDEKENTLRDSTKCRYSLREPIYRSCNSQKCEEARYEQLQNDAAVSYASEACIDHFGNCKWAYQAKLCSYDYYRDNCCISCGGGGT